MTTIQDFITTNGITATATLTDRNPHMADTSMTHYRVFLRAGGRSMLVHFSMGAGLTLPPTAADVLDCLASDASGHENAKSFDDWCSEYGYDPDSRKAEKIYDAIGSQTMRLQRLLGMDAFNALLWDTERL